jgi:response regulator RpfG family c-di-GMP phosphodiesterase
MMSDRTSVDICVLGDKAKAVTISNAASEFGYSSHVFENLDEVFECSLEPTLTFFVEELGGPYGIDEVVQAGRQQFPNAAPILVVEKELTKEKAAFLERQGVRLTLLRHEIETGKVGFLISQILKANYIPLKSIDLVPDVVLPFTVYHLLPQRKKFLKLVRSGDVIGADRMSRLLENPEFYIDRTELMSYKQYVDSTADQSVKGLAKRCRANFVALQSEFASLALQVTDESSRMSFHEGQELLARCQKLCEDLLMNLAEFPKAWEIVNSSSIGEFGSLERAPAVAAFSGMLALRSDMKRVDEIMIASLIVDMGILTVPSGVAKAIRDRDLSRLSQEETAAYHRIPSKSIEFALGRKLAIPEKLRNIIVAVYENADGTGFPAKHNDFKIPIESQLIRFAKELDSRIQVRLGQARREPLQVMKEILIAPELKGVFSEAFLNLVRDKILGGDVSELSS